MLQNLNKKALKILTVASFAYLALPVMIFFIGYLRPLVGIPAVLLFGLAFYKSLKDAYCPDFELVCKKFSTVFWFCVVIVLGWVFFSGIGAFTFQNEDFDCRNSIFRYLVQNKWPVVDSSGKTGLVYYIGFWLPCAVIGKIFGFAFGLKFMTVWAAFGVFLVFVNICIYLKRFSIVPLFFLIFFSGLDWIGMRLFYEGDFWPTQHLERWLANVQFSSNTTQLYWVFNQALPAWLAVILILNQKNFRNILFLMSLILISSPFPFVGLMPIVVVKYFCEIKNGQNWKNLFSTQNIIGVVVVGILTAIYLFGNTAFQSTSKINNLVIPPIYKMCVFWFLEFGVYIVFIFKANKKNYLLYVLSLVLLACPYIKVGGGNDFCMRASIPALFILMIMCLDFFYAKKTKAVFYAYFLVLLIGAITPFHEMLRSLSQTRRAIMNGNSVYRQESDVLQWPNFSAPTENSLFFSSLAKPYEKN